MMRLNKPGLIAKSRAGFTLIEIVIVILAIGVLATIAIPRFGDMIGGSKTAATKDEMRTLKIALVGSVKGSTRGYENDVGTLPSGLADLTSKPGGVGNWDRFTRTGWNGPYIDSTGGDYLKDAWGTNYVYNQAGRTIMSIGSGDTITVNF